MSPRHRATGSHDAHDPDIAALESMDALQQLEVFRRLHAYAPAPDDESIAGDWNVLVEEQIGTREFRQWELTSIEPAGDRAAAERLAEELSRGYEPTHPLRPRARTRYRTADGWVVVIAGAMREFRFRLTLAERVRD